MPIYRLLHNNPLLTVLSIVAVTSKTVCSFTSISYRPRGWIFVSLAEVSVQNFTYSYGVPFVSKLHFSRDLVNNTLYIINNATDLLNNGFYTGYIVYNLSDLLSNGLYSI